ncbi:MAG: class I SAM-dependent methyltransferase [Alphaproteobacteria bacterium]|nr:class I SAM-dependent methyltransferase [Alphaproteobacteria bacterium]
MQAEARTYLLDISRETLLGLLDKGKRFAEVGVAEGVFSQETLNRCQPENLLLVDPWICQEGDDYAYDINNVDAARQEARFEAVCKKFEGRNVEILRMSSLDAAALVADVSLDYIYIDANHSFEAVTEDINAWWPKLKPDGVLMGHDYANHFAAMQAGFGVVEAVNNFVLESGCAFIGITHETYPYPTFILAKSWHAKSGEILDRSPILCSFDTGRMNWQVLPMPDGTAKIFLKF